MEIYDISIGGARIVTHKFFPIGTIVRIQIVLNDSEQILKIDGEVKWGKKVPDEDHYEFGLEFIHEISQTIVFLLGHLYGKKQMIPSLVQKVESR